MDAIGMDFEPLQYCQSANHPLIICGSQRLRSSVPAAGCEVDGIRDALDNAGIQFEFLQLYTQVERVNRLKHAFRDLDDAGSQD